VKGKILLFSKMMMRARDAKERKGKKNGFGCKASEDSKIRISGKRRAFNSKGRNTRDLSKDPPGKS